MIEIRYAQIRSLDLSNGEGIGVALFVQGCHFHCLNCFNPETWDFSGGKEWTEEVKNKFMELVNRPYIKRISILGGEPLAEENLDGVLDLVTEVNKRYNTVQYIDKNAQENHNMLNANADEIRLSSPQKTIWLYTGYTISTCKYFDDIIFTFHPSYYHFNPLNGKPIKVDDKAYFIKQDRKRIEIINNIDVLIDGRYVESQRDITIPWVGSSNQRVIRIQESLQKGEIILWQT